MSNIKSFIETVLKQITKKSLRRTLVSTMVIVGLLPVTLGIFIIYIGSTKVITNSIGANFKEIAKGTADKINIILSKEIEELHSLAISPDIKETFKRSNQSNLKILDNQASIHLKQFKANKIEKYISITVMDKNGKVVATTDSNYENNLKPKEIAHTDGSYKISDIYFNEKDEKPMMSITIPVKEDSQLIGSLRAILKIDTIYRVILDVQIDKTGHANLVDSEGSIIICPIFPPRSHSISPYLMNLIIVNNPGWAIAADDAHGGRNSIIGFAPVKFLYDSNLKSGKKRWYVFVRQHPDETYLPIYKLLIIVLLSGILMVAILSTLGIYAANKIGRPILLLKEGAELIGKGNFKHRLTIDTGDEISSLAEEFNHMGEKLMGVYDQLSAEKNKLESIVVSVGNGIIVADDENKAIMINPAAEEILGINKTHIIGRSIFPCHGRPEKIGELMGQPDKLPWFTTYTIGKKTVEIVATSIKSGGKNIGSVMVMRNITTTKRLEKELKEYSEHLERMIGDRTKEIKETKDYLQSLLENANDVIYTVDREGIFTYINQKIEEWGYRKDELIGQPIFSILTTQHRGRRFHKSIKEGIKQIYEIELFNKKGEIRNVVISSSPLMGENEKISGLLGIARDITEHKKMQHQMNRAEKLAAIGQLATGIAHEINNPLGGMQNCVRTLYSEGDNENVRNRYLPLLEKGLKRIESVIKNLLAFAKEPKFDFSLHSLDEIILETLKLVEYKVKDGNIELKLNLNNNTHRYILDYNYLQQVFLNIIINAIQAMPEEGILSIKSEDEKDNLVVTISDTGIGIPQDNISRIFDPFFTTKDVGIGTGLGLSVSYGIIEKLGGRIEVQSTPNNGAVFTITIPKKYSEETVEV
ncbi:MAG: hypothetical protein A3I04_04245 [Nitrospinae bacterium RIFCSPLOWO2_02_FULL_39_110]|nr:MAG: hypothetical protein A2W53_02180 [Nitrospinae bacterium RIFCSPHIGHO2_02_39_11]OGW00300.1 MAG: hypothetical protein A3D97_00160 [Nitrospinae bacterium RIFCSPHIGHO2_12_FULL_39_42]OGW01371.1 MAG: hypothetical protein A3D20_03605 [Nitrospinae bacterium RIFCSPHIGHO2_02_FULL_39_82]OGW02819.1 MAG: hypothetical protein A2Z59_02310 [Nitrospinae bacterium RIFCSPLOWO2_02_39_17]OGW04289.1 MAG: hypothetical protein A3I04_04245 [Nitrospinae bacterium RIFCSPLOWO2_02_FULL_39_110]OGW09526.1 MAG: hypoth